MSAPRLTIVGAGPGDGSLLTKAAEQALRSAGRVLATPRLAELLRQLNPHIQSLSLEGIHRALETEVRDTVVLVSGDAGFYSLGTALGNRYRGRYEIASLGGISSLQALCGKAGVSWEDAETLSLHGRPGQLSKLAGMATFCPKVFLLTGSGRDVKEALELLAGLQIPGLKVTLGQELSTCRERVVSGSPEELLGQGWDGLCAMLLENPCPTDPARRLRDEDFLRDKVPMTKEAVRALALARLEVRPEDVLWDIGAGTGAVAAAAAQRACRGRVYAVERSPQAVELLRKNRERLGLYNISALPGEAPAALEGLPAPDAVFIGGSGGRLEEIVGLALSRNPSARICFTAVTLETLQKAVELERMLGLPLEISCVQVSRVQAAGQYHMLRAENPVYVVSGRRPT